MTELKDEVEVVGIDAVVPYTNNPKKHPDEQVDKIASSIKNFGCDQPIVVDADNEIIKGHGRYQAAQKLGLDEIPIIRQTKLSDAEARAARIADNRTAESAWDDDLLATELDVLEEDEEIDLELTAFDDDELDDLLEPEGDVEKLDAEPLADKDLEDWKILNLYAGIGGNRKLWGNEPDVTAVEYNEQIADSYQQFFPDDEVVVADAHEYLEEHYDEYDFIWSSPPCPTHSRMQKTAVAAAKQGNTGAINHNKQPEYPDMRLYEEIIFLEHFFDGYYVVENVNPYYEPLIEPQESDRHYFWSNFEIGRPSGNVEREPITQLTDMDEDAHAKRLGYELDKIPNPQDYPRHKILNNCIHPEVGKAILDSALETEASEI